MTTKFKLFCGGDPHKLGIVYNDAWDMNAFREHVSKCKECSFGVSKVMGMVSFGRTSESKVAASRENGKRGGRPTMDKYLYKFLCTQGQQTWQGPIETLMKVLNMDTKVSQESRRKRIESALNSLKESGIVTPESGIIGDTFIANISDDIYMKVIKGQI